MLKKNPNWQYKASVWNVNYPHNCFNKTVSNVVNILRFVTAL
jgi:hypothetical protein